MSLRERQIMIDSVLVYLQKHPEIDKANYIDEYCERLKNSLKTEYHYAKWKYIPIDDGELEVNEGDIIVIESFSDEWWKCKTSDNKEGWVPSARLCPITDVKKLNKIREVF